MILSGKHNLKSKNGYGNIIYSLYKKEKEYTNSVAECAKRCYYVFLITY